MDIKDIIQNKIKETILILDLPNIEFEVERPRDSINGDFSANIAMKLAKSLKKAPFEIANEIVNIINKSIVNNDQIFKRITAIQPGFINFYVNLNYLKNEVLLPELRSSDLYKDMKIMVEFTDPNPFKELHIGHLYSNAVGESISRILSENGAKVKKACYQGDVGLHVAKSIWGIQYYLKNENIDISKISEIFVGISDKAKFLGQCYALGATAYEEDNVAKNEIKTLNKQIYDRDNDEINRIYELGKSWSLEYFEGMYRAAGMEPRENHKAFDFYYMESEVANFGKEYVTNNIDNGIFKKSDGAVIFPGEKYGLHNRVFINSQGLPTYEAKELALAPRKYKDFKYDKSLIITANEVSEYFRVLLAALHEINPILAEKTKHFAHGVVKLPQGKMSSRKGNVITAEWLIESVREKSFNYNADKKENLDNPEVNNFFNTERRLSPDEFIKSVNKFSSYENIYNESSKVDELLPSEKIAISTIKYAFLKNSIGGDIEFDIDESIGFEGNTGPYIQYSYVRCNSILQKDVMQLRHKDILNCEKILNTESEINLTKHLFLYPEIVLHAGEELSPHIICNYLYELSHRFNIFYDNCPVLSAEEEEDRIARLKLVSKSANTIKKCLYLLGIQTVDAM